MTARDVLKFKHTFTKRQFIYVLNKMEMGRALRKMREDADLSLRSVAKTVGVSAPFLSDCELGHRAPSTGVLKKLLETLTP